MKNSSVVAGPLGGWKKKPGEELSQQGVNTGRGLNSVGALTASLPAWGGRSLLTAHILGWGPAGAVGARGAPCTIESSSSCECVSECECEDTVPPLPAPASTNLSCLCL